VSVKQMIFRILRCNSELPIQNIDDMKRTSDLTQRLRLFLGIATFFLSADSWAQSTYPEVKKQVYPWIFGLGVNVVDDDGQPFDQVFNASDSWNIPPYPSRLSVAKYVMPGLTVGGNVNFNMYKADKIVNSRVNQSDGIFISADVEAQYHFNTHFRRNKWFDPFVGAGFGYTFRDPLSAHSVSGNPALGMNFWFTPQWGVQLRTTAKFAFSADRSLNYTQHSASILFRLGTEKDNNKEFHRKKHSLKKASSPKKRGNK
jgi:OOP family OmpA-OmpF porin